jgi:hypothetical protein
MSPKDEDFIRFYRDAVIAGHDDPAAETMCHFNLSRDYIVRLLNETIAGCEGQDIRKLTERESARSRLGRWRAEKITESLKEQLKIGEPSDGPGCASRPRRPALRRSASGM